jgi:hypothetical protein
VLVRWMRTMMPLMISSAGALPNLLSSPTSFASSSPAAQTPERRLTAVNAMSPALRAASGNAAVAASANALVHPDLFRWAALLGMSEILEYPEAYRAPLRREAPTQDLAIAQTIGGGVLSNSKLRPFEEQLVELGVAPPGVTARRVVQLLLRSAIDAMRPLLLASSEYSDPSSSSFPSDFSSSSPRVGGPSSLSSSSSDELDAAVREFSWSVRRLDDSKLTLLLQRKKTPKSKDGTVSSSSSSSASHAHQRHPQHSGHHTHAHAHAHAARGSSGAEQPLFGAVSSAAVMTVGSLALALPTASRTAGGGPLAPLASLSDRERHAYASRLASLLWVSTLSIRLLLPAFLADPWCRAARVLATVHAAHRATGTRTVAAEALLPHLLSAIATLLPPHSAAVRSWNAQLDAWAARASSAAGAVAALDAAIATHPSFQ